MKCMTCKKEFKAGELGIPVHQFHSVHMSSPEPTVVPIGAARGYVHVYHIEKASTALRNVTEHIVSAEDQHTLKQALSHDLKGVSMTSATKATYLCTCGAEGVATMAKHLASAKELNRRAKFNHSLHATRAQMKILEEILTSNEVRAWLGNPLR